MPHDDHNEPDETYDGNGNRFVAFAAVVIVVAVGVALGLFIRAAITAVHIGVAQ